MPSFLMNVSTVLYIHPHVDEWFKKTTLLRNDNCQTCSDLFVIIEPLFKGLNYRFDFFTLYYI